MTTSQNSQAPGSWHPTGKWLAFSEAGDLMILPMEGDASRPRPGAPTPFLETPFSELEPRFSPDGRWLAYVSDESGRSEVYVRPFPAATGKWTISTGGGSFPTWSRARHELFYQSADGRIMTSPYSVDGKTFRAEKPQQVTDVLVAGGERGQRRYDVHPDGDRFVIARLPEGGSTNHVVLVFNFFEHLRRIAPVR